MISRRGLLPALLLVTLLIPVASARAGYDPIAGGATKITFDPSFAALLAKNDVKLIARAPARISGRTVTFPVSGGRLDPVAVKGSVDHDGSLVFQVGRRKLPLRSLTLKTTQVRSPLSAKLGGGQLKLATAARLSTRRSGFGLAAKVARIELSAKVAERLDKKLGLRGVFSEGQPFGASVTVAQPSTVELLPGGKATFVPGPAFLAKLKELFVSLNPIAPAELEQGPVIDLPIDRGALAPDGSAGVLQTLGAIEFLRLGAGQVFARELTFELSASTASADLDLEPTPPFAGKLGTTPMLGIGAYRLSSDSAARTFVATAMPLALRAETAALLNDAFAEGGEAFKVGETLGSLSFAAVGH